MDNFLERKKIILSKRLYGDRERVLAIVRERHESKSVSTALYARMTQKESIDKMSPLERELWIETENLVLSREEENLKNAERFKEIMGNATI